MTRMFVKIETNFLSILINKEYCLNSFEIKYLEIPIDYLKDTLLTQSVHSELILDISK